MKHVTILMALFLAAVTGARAANDPLEYQIAVIDAGKHIQKSDSSIERAKELLERTAKIYRITPIQAADVAAKGKEIAQKSGIKVGIAEILDGALIYCDVTCSLDDMKNFVVFYLTARQTTNQTHHQAVHGILVLNAVAKIAVQNSKTK